MAAVRSRRRLLWLAALVALPGWGCATGVYPRPNAAHWEMAHTSPRYAEALALSREVDRRLRVSEDLGHTAFGTCAPLPWVRVAPRYPDPGSLTEPYRRVDVRVTYDVQGNGRTDNLGVESTSGGESFARAAYHSVELWLFAPAFRGETGFVRKQVKAHLRFAHVADRDACHVDGPSPFGSDAEEILVCRLPSGEVSVAAPSPEIELRLAACEPAVPD